MTGVVSVASLSPGLASGPFCPSSPIETTLVRSSTWAVQGGIDLDGERHGAGLASRKAAHGELAEKARAVRLTAPPGIGEAGQEDCRVREPIGEGDTGRPLGALVGEVNLVGERIPGGDRHAAVVLPDSEIGHRVRDGDERANRAAGGVGRTDPAQVGFAGDEDRYLRDELEQEHSGGLAASVGVKSPSRR